MSVYAVREAGTSAVKIGLSDNPELRMVGLQVANPRELILEHVFDGGESLEARVHLVLWDRRIRGEWFKASGEEVVQAILDARALPEKTVSARVGGGFKKGHSGNPGGRPVMPKEVLAAFREATHTALKTLLSICESGTNDEKARAAEKILDRAWGRARTKLDNPP